MTFIYEVGFGILKVTKMKFLGQGFHKLQHEQNRQTDRHKQMHYKPHLGVVLSSFHSDILCHKAV